MQVFLIFALQEEFRPLRRRLPALARCSRPVPHWRAEWPDLQLVVGISGMGAAAALRRLTQLTASLGLPQWLISAGFGGALEDVPPVGTVHLATSVWHYQPAGDCLTAVPVCPPPGALRNYLQETGLPVTWGPLLTTPEILSKDRLRPHTTRLPHAVVDLESAPLAAWAREHGCHFLGVRAITDGGREDIAPFLAAILNAYRRAPLKKLMAAVLQDYRRLSYLRLLQRRASLAARRLAGTLLAVLAHLRQAGQVPGPPEGQGQSR